jgi:hypothetical protein
MKPHYPLVIIMLLGTLAHGAEPFHIENNVYSVTVNPADSSFSVQSRDSGKTVLSAGKLSGTGGTAKVLPLTDKTFGAGNGIEVIYPDGNRETVALYPGLPFVLFRLTLHNAGSEPVVMNHVPTVSAAVELDKPIAGISTLGTGGLLAPAANPGSYAFLAAVDPASRKGGVGGWLTHDRGSGVVFSPVADGKARLQAQIDYGRLRIKPGADAETETFALGWFDDARLGLEAYADAIAKVYDIKLPPQPAGFCTWYTDKYSRACDETHLPLLAEAAAKELKPFGFDFVQIDDGWQAGDSKNGPNKNFTTHRPKGAYPSGMKAMADKIKSFGLDPGIWFMPFAGNYNDPYFQDHQDWFAKGPDGKPFETAWGGTCLDMTNAGAREHLRDVVQRIAHEWGYTVFKMDGFWTGSATKQVYVNNGYVNDKIGEAEFSDPDVTNIEALRSGVKLIRKTAGPGVYLLGCCVSQNMRSFGGSFGLLDGMRIGPDTSGRIGSTQGSRLWFLNNRVWHNDPDCVYVRASTPVAEARLNASWTAISGQLFYDSDWIPDLPADRLDILRRCMPAHGLPSRPVDVFEAQPARVWLLTDTRGNVRRDVIALYNWSKGQANVSYPLDKIGLPPAKEYVAFDFWANKFVPPFRDRVSADFTGEGCRILAVRPVSGCPQLLGTSRHVTQGMVDVTGEKWDAALSTLSGAGRVVANDPYELRIVVPAGEKSWRVKGITVSQDDTALGVTASFNQDGPRIRARIISPASREVRWEVAFEQATVTAAPPKAVENLKAVPEYRSVGLAWTESGADAYRVARSDGMTFECYESAFTDITSEHGKQYRYTVSALGWDGSPPGAATVDVSTPAELKPPATVRPDVHLSDLKPVSIQTGHVSVGVDKNSAGKPLIVAGKKYQKGLGLHSNALIVFAIPAGATRFVSVVGIDDLQLRDPHAGLVFEVYGDVKEMGEKPLLIGQSPELSSKTIRNWAFNIELNTRFKEVRLVVTHAGEGAPNEMADWVDAGFVTGAGPAR